MEALSKIYEAKFATFKQEKEKIVYFMLILNRQSGAVVSLRKRYSELRDLHDRLEKKIKEYHLDVYLPIFPGRSLVSKTNNDSKKIEGRKSELQQYFNDLLQIGKLHSLDLLKEYLPTARRVLARGQSNSAIIPVSETDNDKGFFKARLSENLNEDRDQELLLVDGMNEQDHQIKVAIDRYNYIDDTMYFYVSFYDNISHEEWVYRTRYSTLKRFHETLQDKNLKAHLKKFPSRKIFGITNEDPESIEKRRKELEEYLDYAFSQQEVLQNEYVKYFLEDTKSQYLQTKKQEDLKKKKIKKLQEEKIRKQANEIVAKAKMQGKILDSDSLKKQLLQKMATPNSNNDDDQFLENQNDDGSYPTQLKTKKGRSANLNMNPKGLLKGILTIVPEEMNVEYIDE